MPPIVELFPITFREIRELACSLLKLKANADVSQAAALRFP